MSVAISAAPAAAGGRTFVQSLLRWVSHSHGRALAVLSLLGLLCFLPGISTIPPVDRDEARFVQSTKQMLETGNFVDIRFQEGTRYKKPIGIYWLQASVVSLTGNGAEAPIWTYRLASVLGALAAVLLTYWACLPLFGRTAGFVAAAALATSVALTFEAHSAKTDATLLATIVLTQGALVRVYLWRGGDQPPLLTVLGFWAGLGLGILVKGPIVLMVAGLTIVTLVAIERRANWLWRLRPATGIPVLMTIVLPWFVAILSIAGDEFLGASVGHDLLGKVASGQEGHWAPPGIHFIFLWVMFAPAAALVPALLRWIWRERNSPPVRFCLAWIIPPFLVFEAVVTKLPHYTLPTYPAIAALLGGAVAASGLTTGWLSARLPPILASLGIVVAAFAGVVILHRFGGGLSPLALAAVIAIAGAVLAIGPAWRGAPANAGALLIAAAVPLYALAFGAVIPGTAGLWLTPRLSQAIPRTVPCANPQIASAGYHEASLIFALGTGIRLVEGKEAADFLGGDGCRLALVSAKSEKAFLARATKAGLQLERIDRVEGIRIGRVEMMTVSLWRSAAKR